jgi:RimJ/RimL family protein N-acetyltransferase
MKHLLASYLIILTSINPVFAANHAQIDAENIQAPLPSKPVRCADSPRRPKIGKWIAGICVTGTIVGTILWAGTKLPFAAPTATLPQPLGTPAPPLQPLKLSKTIPIAATTLAPSQATVTIESARLIAYSLQPSDKPFFEKLLKNEQIMLTLWGRSALSDSEIDNMFNTRWLQAWRSGNPYSAFIIKEKLTQQPIGYMRLQTCNIFKTYIPGEAQIAYAVLPQFQNQGFGTEMVATLVHAYAVFLRDHGYLAQGKPLGTVNAWILKSNSASQKMIGKIGFVQNTNHTVSSDYYYEYQLPS